MNTVFRWMLAGLFLGCLAATGGVSEFLLPLAAAAPPAQPAEPDQSHQPGPSAAAARAMAESSMEGMRKKFADRWVNKPAPDFTAHDPDGKPVRISDFRGKVILQAALTKAGIRLAP